MKKQFLFAVLGLAAALFVFGESSAKADHFRTGYGTGYGSYRGGVGVTRGYGFDRGYRGGFDRGYGGGFHRGHGGFRPPVPPSCRNRGYYGGYGNNINVLTPGLNLGVRY